jgi:hypothetical protein
MRDSILVIKMWVVLAELALTKFLEMGVDIRSENMVTCSTVLTIIGQSIIKSNSIN